MGTDIRGTFGRALDVLTFVVLCAAVWLLVDARAARRGGADSQTVEAAPPTVAPSVRAVDGEGDTVQVEAREGPGLLYVFRSDCPACAAQKPEWVELARLASDARVPVTALTPEPLDPAVARYFEGERIRVLQLADPRDTERLGARMVPTTLALGPGGRVLAHRVGRLSPAGADSLRALLAGLRAGRTFGSE